MDMPDLPEHLMTSTCKTDSRVYRLKLVGRSETTTPILNVETAEMLRPSLPALRRLTQKWTLLYSLDQHGGAPVKVFKWTGKNDYVRLCESDFISFGGGNGKFGLYLDSALLGGESASCPTFDNEILCSRPEGTPASGTVKFECVGIEAWGIA
ncbi:oxidation resistance protein 1 [Ceratobasidium sp. 394]|nr:oxidation resistance protein 1 [Ceratobasidium sp. 394]